MSSLSNNSLLYSGTKCSSSFHCLWMAQSFLNPLSSIAPTAYIVWQNFVNSYQIYRKDRERERTRPVG